MSFPFLRRTNQPDHQLKHLPRRVHPKTDPEVRYHLSKHVLDTATYPELLYNARACRLFFLAVRNLSRDTKEKTKRTNQHKETAGVQGAFLSESQPKKASLSLSISSPGHGGKEEGSNNVSTTLWGQDFPLPGGARSL